MSSAVRAEIAGLPAAIESLAERVAPMPWSESGRCEGEPDPMREEDAEALERDWQAINLVVRELSRLFPDVAAFEVTLADQELRVRRGDISPAFDESCL